MTTSEDRQILLSLLARATTDFRRSSTLADDLDIGPTELDQLLKKLEDEGLIRRPIAAHHDELTWWRLTSRGLTRREKIRAFLRMLARQPV